MTTTSPRTIEQVELENSELRRQLSAMKADIRGMIAKCKGQTAELERYQQERRQIMPYEVW